MRTFETLTEELKPHLNELCLLYDTDIVRLIGVGVDDMDLYYIVQNKNHRPTDGGSERVVWASAVGGLVPLKGILPRDSYERAYNTLGYNGCPAVAEFLIKDARIWDEERSSLAQRISRCGRFAMKFSPAKPDSRFSLWRRYPGTMAPDAFLFEDDLASVEAIASQLINIDGIDL